MPVIKRTTQRGKGLGNIVRAITRQVKGWYNAWKDAHNGFVNRRNHNRERAHWMRDSELNGGRRRRRAIRRRK